MPCSPDVSEKHNATLLKSNPLKGKSLQTKYNLKMNKSINYFIKNRTLYLAIAFTLVFFIYITTILTPLSSCFKLETGASSIGLSFSYTSEMVQKFFEARTQEQLLCYSKFLQIWDSIFAFLYTLMYASWIVFFFNNKRFLLIVPILCMVADWAENYVELSMLKIYLNSGALSENLVSKGSGINSFKWILSSITFLLLLIGIIIKFKALLSKPKLN